MLSSHGESRSSQSKVSGCNPWVASSILAWPHACVEIDHEIISTVSLLPSAYSRRVVVSCKRTYVYEVFINRLVKLAQEKSVVMWTDRPDMTLAVVWDVKHQIKQTNQTI